MVNHTKKTFFFGFHDGQRVGEEPICQCEMIPVPLNISHKEAIGLFHHLERMVIDEISRIYPKEHQSNPHKMDDGAW